MPVCGGVEAYKERSFCVKYRSQGVQTLFYESTPSASEFLGNMISRGITEDSGNPRANFPNASKERNLRNISRHSRVLFKCIPGTQVLWRVAPSYRLDPLRTDRAARQVDKYVLNSRIVPSGPSQKMSVSCHKAHHKLRAEYHRKRRLHVQIDLQDAY